MTILLKVNIKVIILGQGHVPQSDIKAPNIDQNHQGGVQCRDHLFERETDQGRGQILERNRKDEKGQTPSLQLLKGQGHQESIKRVKFGDNQEIMDTDKHSLIHR